MLRDMTRATVEAEVPTGHGKRSFEHFFEVEHVRLYRALVMVTGDRHEAEDALQDAFIKLWERWEKVGSLDDPVGYLYRTAMNVLRMRARRARVAARRLLRERLPADPLERVDERDRLDRALERLTLRQRAAVILIDVYRFKSEEAGRILRASPVTVRRLAAKGRSKVRDALEDNDA